MTDHQEPDGQQQRDAVKDRASGQPFLLLAVIALDLLAVLYPRIARMAEALSTNAPAPMRAAQELATLLLAAEPLE